MSDESENGESLRTISSPCPYCGASIRSTKMPNGGWAVYEVIEGTRNIKHSCFHPGLGYSKARCPLTSELFP